MKTNSKQQLEAICEGTEEVLPLDGLEKKLRRSAKTGKPLIVKFGVDPTSPDLHLGHSIALKKLRTFQDLGHKIILLIGDYTARIGDPSERIATRPQLSVGEIKRNAQTYTEQAFKILSKKRIKIDYNSRWFTKMTFADVLKLSAKFTVARLIERDDFAKRFKENIPISLHEFIYPVMQAYDSIVLKADIEVGGTDQKFNMLAGRGLQEKEGQEPQVVITLPILEGLDGVQKMSKSLGNHVGLTEAPEEMFGKIMSISDELMVKYFEILANLDNKELTALKRGLKSGRLHPAKTKRRLAKEIISQYYDQKAAHQAEQHFNTVFREKELPSELPETIVAKKLLKDKTIWIVELVKICGFAKTNGEAKRLVQQGGVKINNQGVKSTDLDIGIKTGDILQVGKRNFAKIKIT